MKIKYTKLVESNFTTLKFYCKPEYYSCSWYFFDENGKEVNAREKEYVPDFIPGDFEDYINLEIDIETGKILNWNPNLVKKYYDGLIKNVNI